MKQILEISFDEWAGKSLENRNEMSDRMTTTVTLLLKRTTDGGH